MRILYALLITLFCIPAPFLAQNPLRDSLRSALKAVKHDTSLALAYVSLGEDFYLDDPDSAYIYFQKTKAICEINLKRKLDPVVKKTFLNHLGTSMQNTGLVLQDRGDIPSALDHFFKALRIKEEIGVVQGAANCNLAIGGVYSVMQDTARAMFYYTKSIPQYESIGDKSGIGAAYNNIGTLYHELGDTSRALYYFKKTLAIEEQIGDRAGMAYAIGAIGSVYMQSDPFKALPYLKKSMQLHEELGNKFGVSAMLNNIGTAFYKQKKYSEAEKCYSRALQLSREIYYPESIMDAAKELVGLYKLQKNGMKALEMHELYVAMRDTIKTQDARRASIQKHIQYEYDKKAAADSIANADQIIREKIKHDGAIKQQRIYTYSGIAGFILMVVIATISFRAYRNKQKANEVISRQKNLVEEQKTLIEEKQKEIIDSIMYARRIQRSLLAHEKYIDKTLRRLTKKT